MSEDAEKKIARLMRESTTSGESSSGQSKTRVWGSGNLVALGAINVTINLHAAAQLSTTPTAPSIPPPTPTKDEGDRTLDRARKNIRQKCADLGDPHLYQPFILSLFKTDRLEDLSRGELDRLEWWLGLRKERPTG
jgi:hypothetical protein